MRFFRRVLIIGLTAGAMAGSTVPALATPYASNVSKVGTTVNFTLNEPADTLKYSINGGPLVSLSGAAKGTKTFNLGLATDTFSIVAENNSATGYTIPTGNQLPVAAGSLNIATNEGGLKLISDDASLLTRFALRGIGVSNSPNAPNFGTVYISNSDSADLADPVRPQGDGFYALRADGSDAFGYGDAAQNPNAQDGFPVTPVGGDGTQRNSPYRLHVASTGEIYEADFADANSSVFILNPNLSQGTILFKGINGTSGAPAGQNHGSVISVAVTGSLATNDLVVYTLDEDLTTAKVTGAGSTTDVHSVWKYTLSGPVPTEGFDTMPVKAATALSGPGNTFSDMDRGADGKIYLSVNPNAANPNTTRLVVRDPSDNLLFDSFVASQALGQSADIIANLNQIAVSPDQKWLAGELNFSDVVVIPLINGIPDLANRLVVDAGAVNSGRDISFDAADNIHVVSSGDARYRALSPGGHTITTLTWNGTTYSFNLQNVVAISGDFNNDGKVDARDYVILRKQNADITTGTGLANYNAWRTNFGTGVPGSGSSLGNAAVPEPTTAMMLFIAGLFGTFIRRRSVG